jgi:uncharacterized repeat protein (TIGR03837 family)
MPSTCTDHPAPPAADTLSCDLFCAVIDNFGDVGVCWRLARQLSSEYGWQVRLLVDDLHTFARLCPALDAGLTRQRIDGVVVEHWHEPAHPGDPLTVADIVIEAFACDLPQAYVAAMARRQRSPVWLNLEYLSAEDWVAECHLKPSPHMRYPLTKTFFFPGLGPGTGGVIKEQSLDDAREAFASSAPARDAWWRQATGAAQPGPDTTVISLFCYENPAIDSLLEQWGDGAEPIVLLAPEGRISGALARFFGLPAFGAGAHAERGALRAHSLGFRPQPEFDALLWASHLSAGKIPSCGRNGHAVPLFGTFTRKRTRHTCPSSMPRLPITRARWRRRHERRSVVSGTHGTGPERPTGQNSGSIAARTNRGRRAGRSSSPPSATSPRT